MKTKRFCKSTVSLLLVVMMLMSIVTMGVVNVSAAQTDIAETSATATNVFFKSEIIDSGWGYTNHKMSISDNVYTYSYAVTSDKINKSYGTQILIDGGNFGCSNPLTGTGSIDLSKNAPDTFSWTPTVAGTYTFTFVHNKSNLNKGTLTITCDNSSGGESGGGTTSSNYFTVGDKVYLYNGGTSLWGKDNPWYIAHFYNSVSGKTYDVYSTSCGDANYFYFTVPSGEWDKVSFLRMNPATSSLNSDWTNVWNRVEGLSKESGKNCFKITDWGKGNWDNHTCSGSTVDPTTPTTPTTPSGPTKTVYVGIIEYVFNDNKTIPTLSYSGGATGTATLVATGESASFNISGEWSGWSNPHSFRIYTAKIPAEATTVSLSPSGYSGTYEEGKIILYFHHGNYHYEVVDFRSPDLADPVESADTVYFYDDTSNNSLDDEDAKIFVEDLEKEKIYEMIETIDYKNGKNLWYAKLDADAKSSTTGTFKFYRTSVFATVKNLKKGSNDGGNWWDTWTTPARGTKITYRAKANGAGEWSDLKSCQPDNIAHFTYGVWVDTKGAGNTVDAVKWFNKTGNEYHLYLPSYTNLNSVKLYTSFNDAKITGGYYSSPRTLTKNVANTLKIKEGTSSYTFDCSEGTYTLKIFKSDYASTMLMDTNRDLWTGKIWFGDDKDWPKGKKPEGSGEAFDDKVAAEYKDAIKTSGTYAFYDESGAKLNTNGNGKAAELKSIKGRGNSTFKASMKVYGKYAYNFNLSTEQTLIKGATAAKKWCLLANNVDHSMMRNTFIYNLADDIGIKYAPETQLVDVYNEGNYLGAYVLTEKVEYGSGTLMDDMESLDEYHDDVFKDYEEDKNIESDQNTVTLNGSSYTYKYWKGIDNFKFDYDDGDESFKQKNFLLEFEINERYQNELSWFKSDLTNQRVVVKYPEYVTQKEMEWIVNLWAKVEDVVYGGNASLDDLSAVIDVDSFVKMYLIQELTLNLDAAATSFYIHNEGDLLVASPVWDYDWSMGSFINTKPIQNGYSLSLDNPNQMFAKYKIMDTGKKEGDNLNFQAQLAHNSAFWYEVQKTYTNIFVPVLDMYVYNNDEDNDGMGGYTEEDIILSEYLPKFKPAMAMNEARWKGLDLNLTNDGWGTKVTSDYSTFSASSSNKKFNEGKNDASSTSTEDKYINTVYYLNDWLATRWNYLSSGDKPNHADDDFYLDNERYKLVKDLTFGVTTSGQTVTLTPSIEITKNKSPIAYNEMKLIVYVNGEVRYNDTMTNNLTLHLDGGTHDIQLKAYPKDFPQFYRTSETKTVTVTKDGEAAKIKVYFKSSDSYRYAPAITIGEKTINMTKTGEAIYSENAPDSTAQSYHWYEADVDIIWGEDLTVNFTNIIGMNATCTVSEVRALELHFVVDNLNTGKEAINVSNYLGYQDYQRNMVKSAVNMFVNDPTAASIAYTAFGGRSYVLGDTDSDEVLSILDVTTIQRALAKKVELNDTTSKLADFDLDGIASITDATNIQVFLAQ